MRHRSVGAVYDRTFFRFEGCALIERTYTQARDSGPGKCTALLVLFLILLSCSAPESTEELSTVRIAVGGQAQYVYLPLTLADKLGYFAEEGLEVEISDLRGGSQALAALTGGSVDAVVGFYEHTIRSQARGKGLVMVTLFDRIPGLVMMIGTPHADEVRSIGDLVGKPFGVTAPGSSTDAMVKFLLRKEGYDPQAIPVVTAGTTTMIAAIEQDQVWGGITVDPLAQKLERDGTARPLYDTRTEEGTREVFGGPWPAGGLYIAEESRSESPRVVQALVNAAVRTLRYISTHSADEIADHVPEFWVAGNRDLYVEALDANLGMFSPDGRMPEDGPANVLDTLSLVDPTLSPDSIDLERTYDNSFASRVPD